MVTMNSSEKAAQKACQQGPSRDSSKCVKEEKEKKENPLSNFPPSVQALMSTIPSPEESPNYLIYKKVPPVEMTKNRNESTINMKENENPRENVERQGTAQSTKVESWGYDLYPERRGTFKPKIGNILIGKEGKESLDKIKCEKNVYQCVKESPIVKVMIAALKSSGCPIDIRRHISCEVCDYSVSGGYDPELNQIVVCQNVSTREGMVQGVLTHEMIHMFDYCRNNLDFRNMEHLACTEIRAANLTHCSFVSAWSQGDASWTKIKQAHQDCVKTKALYSVLAVRQISKAEAVDVIEKVFPKCYADLEPIGRRIRRNSEDMFRAFREAAYYGYE